MTFCDGSGHLESFQYVKNQSMGDGPLSWGMSSSEDTY